LGNLAGAQIEKVALYRMVTDLLALIVADIVFGLGIDARPIEHRGAR
jgi:hypothetical protein